MNTFNRFQENQYVLHGCPPDGNCLFSALRVCRLVCTNLLVPSFSDRADGGLRCRKDFLAWVRPLLIDDQIVPNSDGLSIRNLLLDTRWASTVDEYLSAMSPPIESRSQWGGWGEALCVAHEWKLQVAIFVRFSDGSLALCVGPAGLAGASGVMCLLWSRTHYDAIRLNPPADVSQLFPAAVWA